jgi:serine/threonine protein kinase
MSHPCGVIFNLLCHFLFMHEFIGQKGGVYKTSPRPFRKGAFGRIYRAHPAIDTPFLAAKSDIILKFAKRAGPEKPAQTTITHSFRVERSVLEGVSHPNIVRLYDHGEHRGLPFLVEERCPGRPLVHRLSDAVQWKSMALGLLDALSALHENGIAHGDLDGRNFIFDGKTFKLIDFGSSIMLDTRTNPRSWCVDMDLAVEILMRQLSDVRGFREADRNALVDALRDGSGLCAMDLKEAILQTGSLP